jgi:hypothetical protein
MPRPLFTKDSLVPPNNDELEITVFGPRYGESVVLHIPEIGWGVIDSCVSRINGVHVVPALEYLNCILSDPYPKLAFVILTHPHEDHYKGIDDILNKYNGGVERVCRYHGVGTRELMRYIVDRQEACKNDLPGLISVFRAMKDAAIPNGKATPRRLSEMTVVFEKKGASIEKFGKTDIRMVALSPSSDSDDRYASSLARFRVKPGEPVRFVGDEQHNLISTALLLSVGDMQAVFGADLQNEQQKGSGWDAVLAHADMPGLSACFVKVSHHGSENGYNEEAWKQHCERQKPLAVITPFVKGSVQLPREGDVQRVRRVAEKVGITGDPKNTEDLHKYYPRDVARRVLQDVRSARVFEPLSGLGFLRARFHVDGTIVETHAQAPGRWF